MCWDVLKSFRYRSPCWLGGSLGVLCCGSMPPPTKSELNGSKELDSYISMGRSNSMCHPQSPNSPHQSPLPLELLKLTSNWCWVFHICLILGMSSSCASWIWVCFWIGNKSTEQAPLCSSMAILVAGVREGNPQLFLLSLLHRTRYASVQYTVW